MSKTTRRLVKGTDILQANQKCKGRALVNLLVFGTVTDMPTMSSPAASPDSPMPISSFGVERFCISDPSSGTFSPSFTCSRRRDFSMFAKKWLRIQI